MRTTSKATAHSRRLCRPPHQSLAAVGIITSSLRQARIKISSAGSGQSAALSQLSTRRSEKREEGRLQLKKFRVTPSDRALDCAYRAGETQSKTVKLVSTRRSITHNTIQFQYRRMIVIIITADKHFSICEC